jgi:hypothetical protein
MEIIFIGVFFLIAILFLTASKSRWYYQKVVEDNDEKYANQVIKCLKLCGYLLFIFPLIWLFIIFFGK